MTKTGWSPTPLANTLIWIVILGICFAALRHTWDGVPPWQFGVAAYSSAIAFGGFVGALCGRTRAGLLIALFVATLVVIIYPLLQEPRS